MSKRKEKVREFLRMSKKQLQRVLDEKKEKLRQFRFDLTTGKVKNVREIRSTRKDIARILTLLNKKQELTSPQRES